MNVKICDRCGKEMEPLLVFKGYNGAELTIIDATMPYSSGMHYDLCQKCQKELYNFLEMKGENK